MLRRSVLRMSGIGPIRQTLIGGGDDLPPDHAGKLFTEMEALGRDAL